MTNNEILRADLLDIVFEKRNKEYGAYALRRGYGKRLFTALGAALSAILIIAAFSTLKPNVPQAIKSSKKENIVELREIVIPKEKTVESQKPKEIVKPKIQPKTVQKKIATEKLTSKIDIKPDHLVKEKMPDVTNMKDKEVGDTKITGQPAPLTPKLPEQPINTGSGNTATTVVTSDPFTPQERDPQFPGGADALRRFLASNLQSPSEMEAGEKKTVLIRFKVDKDGSVNTFEIVTSGGNEFDREVVRVCRKMPRWMPALQNGINVPVSYVLPITFIGAEQ